MCIYTPRHIYVCVYRHVNTACSTHLFPPTPPPQESSPHTCRQPTACDGDSHGCPGPACPYSTHIAQPHVPWALENETGRPSPGAKRVLPLLPYIRLCLPSQGRALVCGPQAQPPPAAHCVLGPQKAILGPPAQGDPPTSKTSVNILHR